MRCMVDRVVDGLKWQERGCEKERNGYLLTRGMHGNGTSAVNGGII